VSKDYYAALGVQRDASEDEVKKAFRRLAHAHHPDKGGDQKKFKDINEAYQILSDKTKRQQYDQFGSAVFEQGASSRPGSGFGGFEGGINLDLDDLGDLFGSAFGFGSRHAVRELRGNDIQTEISIDFLDSVRGVTKTLKLYKHDACERCDGNGAEPGTKRETCSSCKGSGQVQHMNRTIFGTIQTSTLCQTCQGQGSKPTQLCTSCKGAGVERKTKELQLHIPGGIIDGEAVKLSGAGEYPGPGGKPGDLYVQVRVKTHPTLQRDGYNVLSTVRIPYTTLTLGGSITLETVDGTGELKIPEATEAGAVFKLRNRGFVHPRSGNRGDQLVTVQPLVQSKLNKEQRRILENLRDMGL